MLRQDLGAMLIERRRRPACATLGTAELDRCANSFVPVEFRHHLPMFGMRRGGRFIHRQHRAGRDAGAYQPQRQLLAVLIGERGGQRQGEGDPIDVAFPIVGEARIVGEFRSSFSDNSSLTGAGPAGLLAAPGNPFSSSASVTKLGAGFDYALTNNITIGVGISATQVRPNWP